jgi:hypothetical protein
MNLSQQQQWFERSITAYLEKLRNDVPERRTKQWKEAKKREYLTLVTNDLNHIERKIGWVMDEMDHCINCKTNIKMPLALGALKEILQTLKIGRFNLEQCHKIGTAELYEILGEKVPE